MQAEDENFEDDDRPQMTSFRENKQASSPYNEENDATKYGSITNSESNSTAPIQNDNKDYQRPTPNDRLYLVYLIFTLHGVGMLMSWNMFITIAPQYYHDYWFSYPNGTATHYANSFMSIIGVTSQIPNLGVMFINMAFIVAGYMMLRVVTPLILNCFLIAVIVFLVVFAKPSDDSRNWFYIVTLIIIMLMNLSNGIYQNSIYGIVADFPDNYINSLVIGNNLCGVFTSLMSIMTTLISPNSIELNALLYFSISLGVMIVCLLSLYILVRLPFYRHYMALGLEARLSEKSENPSIRQYLECLKYCWVQLFNNFYVYFISLAIFPAMMTDTPFYKRNPNDHSVFRDDLYYSINTFLNFNVCAWIGSTVANYVQYPTSKYLWIFVLLRTLFLPFFMFCNYMPSGNARKWPVFFKSEWWFFFGCSIMAFTCGHFSSLALIYTPNGVPANYQKLSGMLASIFLMGGILIGVASTPLFGKMVTDWMLASKMRKIKSSYGNKLTIPRIEVRRSSSLQFAPSLSPIPIDESKLSEVSGISISSSLYTLNLSDFSRTSHYSLYMVMIRYRCFFGCCRLRVGACIIGAIGIALSVLTMCILLTASMSLSKEWQDLISLPITSAVLFQSASSMLLIVGILIDTYSMLIPFILNCVIYIILSITCMCWLVLASEKLPSEAIPLGLISCVAVIIIYLWFATMIGMTLILIRDKKRLGIDLEDYSDNRNVERASSSFL